MYRSPIALVILGSLACADAGEPFAVPQASVSLSAGSGGSRIAFHSNRDDPASTEIYLMNPDGSGQTRLTDHPAADANAAWFPDGRLTFQSNRTGRFGIYIIDPQVGEPAVQLSESEPGDFDPEPSPDGRRIAFTRSDVTGDIYLMNPDGSGLRQLTTDPADDLNSSWSPDGKRIAFTSDRDGNLEIYVMNADGSGQTRLTVEPAEDGTPAWSPDGRRIAFNSTREGVSHIYLMNPDGSGQTRVTNAGAFDFIATWSPDGRRIGFMRGIGDGNTAIFTVRPDGSDERQLTQEQVRNRFPAWGHGSQ